jgi:hypothetical protein
MIQRWYNLILTTHVTSRVLRKVKSKTVWKYFHSVTYMRQKRIVFGPTRFKRRRYKSKKHKNIWQQYYNILRYWVEDYKFCKQSIRSSQLTSRFKYSYLILDSNQYFSTFLTIPDTTFSVFSGSVLTKSHYSKLNKTFFIYKPLYNKIYGGGKIIHGSSTTLNTQFSQNDKKITHFLYLYSDNQLLGVSSFHNDRHVLIWRDFILFFFKIILYWLVEFYKTQVSIVLLNIL